MLPPLPLLENALRHVRPSQLGIKSLESTAKGRCSTFDYLTFRIQGRFSVSQRRHLYLAETSNDQIIMVKFVRRYCLASGICAASGHAPILFAYERLPGSGGYGGRCIIPKQKEIPRILNNCEDWTIGESSLYRPTERPDPGVIRVIYNAGTRRIVVVHHPRGSLRARKYISSS
ncbi:hypothetical protein V8E54_001741 [Elaphomyces granulatus]